MLAGVSWLFPAARYQGDYAIAWNYGWMHIGWDRPEYGSHFGMEFPGCFSYFQGGGGFDIGDADYFCAGSFSIHLLLPAVLSGLLTACWALAARRVGRTPEP